MPPSYVVQAKADPYRTTDFLGDFIAETISCVPLSSAHLQDDTRKIHKLLKKYLVAETDEQCIIRIEHRANCWDYFDTLFRQYSGEGNVIRRVETANRLRETFH